MREALYRTFVGSRGGETRMRIVEEIFLKPRNANELAKDLGVDYSTVRHSLDVMRKAQLIFGGTGYGGTYHLTPEFLGLLQEYDVLIECYRNERKCTERKWAKMLAAHAPAKGSDVGARVKA